MASAGAQAALRGYRLQALYTLYRIFECSEDLSFQLEGREDLDVLAADGDLIEIVQVKAHEGSLTLSNLSPHKAESFFRRVLARHHLHPNAREKIVSFGPIGTDMARAWTSEGSERREVLRYLEACGYTTKQVRLLMSTVILEKVDAHQIETAVLARLRESLVGVDSRSAFELLNAWLFVASEGKQRITRRNVIDRIAAIGSFVAARVAHHEEWYRSIVPLENPVDTGDPEGLAAEFYKGIAARYDHICAGIDVERTERLNQIEEAFSSARLVIVHGASGQGKSALAYRYLRDYVPDGWRFEIRLVESRLHALGIAKALLGHLNAIGASACIYIDVAPGDVAWTDLVRELAQVSKVRLLVSIREEDWKRTVVSGAFLELREIELRFDEAEARLMYDRLIQQRAPRHVLGFDDAWARFGRSGPLLEFAYFIVQNETLAIRLTAQIRRLRDDVCSGNRRPEELDLLRRVAVVTAYGARVDLVALVRNLKLPDPRRTVDLFEREYLLRVGGGGRFIEGLHPIRSELLARLLTEDVLEPWTEAATASLPAIVEEDIETFLLHAFSRRSELADAISEGLTAFEPRTWAGRAGVIRALLWLGVRQYLLQNELLIREVYSRFGSSWQFILMADVGDVDSISPGLMTPLFDRLDFIPEEGRRELAVYRERLTPRRTVFDGARAWLLSRCLQPAAPVDQPDWLGAAEVSFWASHMDLGKHIFPLDAPVFDSGYDSVPLNLVASLMYALSFSNDLNVQHKLESIRPKIVERFQEETQTPHIEDNGQTIRAHFLVDLAWIAETHSEKSAMQTRSENVLHAEAMRRVELLRQIVPNRQAFGCQGYGHQSALFPVDHDDTVKNAIAGFLLPPPWPKRLNLLFVRLGNYLFRPDDWEHYARLIMDVRKRNVEAIECLIAELGSFFRKKGALDIFGNVVFLNRWNTTKSAIAHPPMLPRDAVDEWGQIAEATSSDEQPRQKLVVEMFLALERHEAYRKSLQSFMTPLSNFYEQAALEGRYIPFLRRLKDQSKLAVVRRLMKEQNLPPNVGHLPTMNLAEALRALPMLQSAFREMFVAFFAPGELDAVERRESHVLRSAFGLWYQFAHHAERVLQHAPADASRKLDAAIGEVRRKIKSNFKALESEGVVVEIRSDGVLWDGDSFLCVTFDVQNPLVTYEAFALVYRALMMALPHGVNLALSHRAVLLAWSTIHVVPLVRGKMLGNTAWRFSTIVLVASGVDETLSWSLFVQQPLSEGFMRQLGLVAWALPRLELVQNFYLAAVQLAIFAGCMVRIKEMPEPNGNGRFVIIAYAAAQSERMSAALQKTVDALAAFDRYMTELMRCEEVRERVRLVNDALMDIREQIIPEGAMEGGLSLGADEMDAWFERLQAALPVLDAIRLNWSADVLDVDVSA